MKIPKMKCRVTWEGGGSTEIKMSPELFYVILKIPWIHIIILLWGGKHNITNIIFFPAGLKDAFYIQKEFWFCGVWYMLFMTFASLFALDVVSLGQRTPGTLLNAMLYVPDALSVGIPTVILSGFVPVVLAYREKCKNNLEYSAV